MHEFVIVYMVDSVKIGQRFNLWPLHITLLPWFDAPDLESIQTELAKELEAIKPMEVTVGDRAYFGERKLPVMLVGKSPELQSLHDRLIAATTRNNWQIKGRYISDLFKPHVTKKAGRDASGKLLIDKLHIAEKLPQGYRRIVAEVAL